MQMDTERYVMMTILRHRLRMVDEREEEQEIVMEMGYRMMPMHVVQFLKTLMAVRMQTVVLKFLEMSETLPTKKRKIHL